LHGTLNRMVPLGRELLDCQLVNVDLVRLAVTPQRHQVLLVWLMF
jgi:hypothetical protein